MKLFQRLFDLPIRKKLTLAISANCVLVVLLASVGFVVNDYIVVKDRLLHRMLVQASMVARNTEAAVVFDDKAYCQEMLNSLAVDATIRSARLFLASGELYSSYSRTDDAGAGNDFFERLFETATVSVDIVYNMRKLGTLTLVASQEALLARLRNYPLILLAGFLSSLLVAFFGAKPFAFVIVDPILQLAKTSRQAQRNHYRVHANKYYDDEIGQLTDDFNLMLERMREHSEKLEILVKQRTDSLELLSTVINSSADFIFVKDLELRTVLCNQIFAKAVGCQPAELYGKTDIENGWPEELVKGCPEKGIKGYEDDDLQALSGKTIRNDNDLVMIGGQLRIFDTIKLPIRDADGRITSLLGIGRDITERKAAEREMQLAATVYRAIGEAIMVADANNRIIAVNPAFTQLTGYMEREAIGQPTSLLKSGRHDRLFFQDLWRSLEKTGHWQGEIWNCRKNGEVYLQWLVISTIYNELGEVSQRVAMFSDITDQKRAEQTIWQQANFDTLTGLPNRRMFHDRLEQEIKKAHHAGLTLALLFLDLDRFKEVNDTLGHDMGDVLLKEAAQRLTDCVREGDTVARLGGDEFTVILGELEDSGEVEGIAQEILRQLAEPFQLGTDTVYVSGSIGITLYPEDAATINGLLKNADQAMYAAKKQGCGRRSYFTLSMQETAQARMRMISDLRGAFNDYPFRVAYQPIVDLATGITHKAEALIRWQHPTRGLVCPSEFIHIAEEIGVIGVIGDWVFREAASQVAHWRSAYHPAFQVSVNTSPLQFLAGDNAYAAWFDHLRALALPGQSIVLEITEGLLLDASAAITDKLLAFRNAGMQVAIDDFGTGYSALSYLKKFDIDYLKIDQSFVRSLATDSADLSLCKAIIVMAHELGMQVISEGVETEQQRALLAAAGCDYGQGYLFARPMPAEDFDAWLLARQGRDVRAPNFSLPHGAARQAP